MIDIYLFIYSILLHDLYHYYYFFKFVLLKVYYYYTVYVFAIFIKSLHDTDFEFEMCRSQDVSVGVPKQISLLRMRYCTAKRPKPNSPAVVSNGAAVGPHVSEGVHRQ